MTPSNRDKMLTRSSMLVLVTLLVLSSCIDQRYDFNKGISTSISLGGDSLALPLGSTDTIRLGDFLDPDDVEMMKTMEDGGYALSVKDSISVYVPEIDQESLKIDDQTFTQVQSISFGDIDLEDFSIPGLSIEDTVPFGFNAISLSHFEVPSIDKTETFPAGMSGYAPDDLTVDDIEAEGSSDNLFTSIELPVPNDVPSVPVAILDQEVSFETSAELSFTVDVPEDVTDIRDVLLEDGAQFSVSLELKNTAGVISSGDIVPDVTINPTSLFVFRGLPGGTIRFTPSDALNNGNQFKQTKSYPISALNIGGDPVAGVLSLSEQVVTTGTMALSSVHVYSGRVDDVQDIDLEVKVYVNNIVIHSMVFTLPVIHSTIDGNTPVEAKNTLPSDIRRVNDVYIDNARQSLRFVLLAAPRSLPDMETSSFTIDQLTINFPPEFTFKPQAGLSGSTYTLSNVPFDPHNGFPIELKLDRINMSDADIIGDSIKWLKNITYTGQVSFTGRINSKNIPAGDNDTKMDLAITSNLGFHSADVLTWSKPIDIDPMDIPFVMDIDISDQLKRLNTITLEDNTMVRLYITKPNMPLPLTGRSLTLVFPDRFVFDPPLVNNRLHFNDTINPLPELVELKLSALNINQDLSATGQLSLNEQIRVEGGILLKAGDVNTVEVENLSNEQLVIKATTNDLKIASTTLEMKALSAEVSDSTDLDLPTIDLPDDILSLDSILLANGAKLQLDIRIANMPELSKPLIADIVMDFPSLLGFAPGQADADNTIKIRQAFEGGRLTKTIGLKGLFFDGKDLNGKLDIKEKVTFDVAVSVDESTVDSDQLKNKDITVTVDVKLTDIRFKEVYGKLDPGIEPQRQDIAISGLPSFLDGDDVVLDITKPVITLETESNLGIPIVIDLMMKPTRKGAVIPNAEQNMQLTLPKSASASISKTTKFWIAPDSAGMPQDYVYVPAEIQQLFKTIPDNILFEMKAGTDLAQQHHIDLDAQYFMNVKYDVTVPFAFGEELSIVMRDTIFDLDPMIGESTLAGKSLELFGTFQNSIPLELEVELIPLDGNNAPIDVVPVRQKIEAGARDGSPTPTEVSFKLSDPDGKLKAMRGVELMFRGSSNQTVAGTPIRPDNYIIATLKARLAGGITIDPSNL